MTANTFDPTKVDLDKMSAERKIPLGTLKLALGLPLSVTCEVDTIEEAQALHNEAEGGSEEKVATLNRWNTLSLATIENASTLAEAQAAYDTVPPNTEAEEAALKKLLELCTIAEEAQAVHARTNNPDHESVVLKKWLDLCNTPRQARVAFDATEDDSLDRTSAILKWTSLSLAAVAAASTIREAGAAYYGALEGSEVEALAIEKLKALSSRLLESLTTFEEAETAFANIPDCPEVAEMVAHRWLEFCKKVEDVERVCDSVYYGSEVWEAAQKRRIELCTTPEETQRAYDSVSDNSELEKQVNRCRRGW